MDVLGRRCGSSWETGSLSSLGGGRLLHWGAAHSECRRVTCRGGASGGGAHGLGPLQGDGNAMRELNDVPDVPELYWEVARPKNEFCFDIDINLLL
jgi:hypothetical protein